MESLLPFYNSIHKKSLLITDITVLNKIFRALGLNITAASSLHQIKKVVNEDNDCELIISDIQWRDKENPSKVERINPPIAVKII